MSRFNLSVFNKKKVNEEFSLGNGKKKSPKKLFITADHQTLTRLETVLAAHHLCACESEPSDLYDLRKITPVGRLLLLFYTIDMVFGLK